MKLIQKLIYPLLLIITITGYCDTSSLDLSTYSDQVQKVIEKAQRSFKGKKFEEALHYYEELVNAEPKLPISYIGIGDASAKLGDYPRAITAFQHALKLMTDLQQADRFALEPTVQAKLASAYHRNKQLDAADEFFQKAVKGAGENVPVNWYVALGQIETERGNLEQARRYYIVAVQLSPETTAAFNNFGHVLLKLNRIDEADAVFRQALALDKSLASASYGRGVVAAKRGEFIVAKNYYKQAIQETPNEPIFHKSLADILDKLGDSEAAESSRSRYRKTLAEIYRQQAHQFIQKQQGQPALELLQKAIDIEETYIPALIDYAYVKMQMDELVPAKQTYHRVLKLEPTSRQTLLHLGMIEARLGNRNAAESHLQTLIKHDPNYMDTYSQLAKIRETSGDLIGAVNAYTMGIQHQPSWAPGYWWRGLIYQKQGKSNKAETDFRSAIQHAPDIPYPKDALASLLAIENRKLPEALTLAEEAVAIDQRPTHNATLAYVYYRLERYDDAQRVINNAYTQDPKHPYIINIRTQILQSRAK